MRLHADKLSLPSQDRTEVVSRAKTAGVAAFIVTGSCLKTSRKAAELSEEISEVPVYFTAGVHPHNAKASIHLPWLTCRQTVRSY